MSAVLRGCTTMASPDVELTPKRDDHLNVLQSRPPSTHAHGASSISNRLNPLSGKLKPVSPS
ncbi:MAG: hypothetical protein ACFB21_14145, partial [Opitutales bacterium]